MWILLVKKYLLNIDFMFSENHDGFAFVKLTSLVEENNCWKYFLPNQGISLWCVYRKRSKAICEYVRQESPKRMLPSEIKLNPNALVCQTTFGWRVDFFSGCVSYADLCKNFISWLFHIIHLLASLQLE